MKKAACNEANRLSMRMLGGLLYISLVSVVLKIIENAPKIKNNPFLIILQLHYNLEWIYNTEPK